MDACDECGFAYASVSAADLPGRFGGYPERFRATLIESGASERDLRARASGDTWSAVEYACHVRDVLLAQRERLFLALVEDTPDFKPIYRDQRARLARYADQPVERVLEEIAVASALIADAFAGLSDRQLARTCIYNYPEPAERDLMWLGRHTVHEAEHHLRDIERTLATSRSG